MKHLIVASLNQSLFNFVYENPVLKWTELKKNGEKKKEISNSPGNLTKISCDYSS